MSVCPICYENETQLETNCGHRLRFYRSNRMYKEGCVFFDAHFVRTPHGEDVPHFTWTSREFLILIIT